MNDMTPAPISVERFGPIDRDEAYDRDYIPLPGGWEIQTKGKGSTYRICDPNNDDLAIPASPYLHDTLTQMARDVHASHTALLHQLEEMEAEVESTLACNRGLVRLNEAVTARAESAERAREELQAKLDALLEVGPILSECRWFLVDMHIWPPETTCAMSVDLLPKVDDAIIKAHAALGHPASTTSAAFLAASGGENNSTGVRNDL